MDDYIIVNGDRYPCRVSLPRDREHYYAKFVVAMTYEEAREIFTSNAELVIDYGEDTKPLPDYRILHSLMDKMNGEITVTYQKLTDTEKLIELHYGGAN